MPILSRALIPALQTKIVVNEVEILLLISPEKTQDILSKLSVETWI
jgi:hypothetical protein